MAKEKKVFKTMVVELTQISYIALKQEQTRLINNTGKIIPLNKIASAILIKGIQSELKNEKK